MSAFPAIPSAQETAAPPPAAPPPAAQPEISGDHRLVLFENFISDAALVRSTWLEARADYADYGNGGHDTTTQAIVAFSLADKVELGGSFGYLDRERSEDQTIFGERLGSDVSNNGFSDVNVYGKFVFKPGKRPWAAGFLIKFPTADEKELLGSGAADYELFVGNRRPGTRATWIWNAAVRFNGDPDFSGGGSGQTSAAAAGGLIMKLSYSWAFLAEARYETRRYDGDDNYFALMPSVDFRPTENIALRLGAAFGLTDGAPNVDYTFGFVFHM